MALGATRNRVVGSIIRDGVLLAAIGLRLGLIGAYFIGRAMQSLLFGVQALDFSAFISVVVVLLAAAIPACFLPARQYPPCASIGAAAWVCYCTTHSFALERGPCCGGGLVVSHASEDASQRVG